MQQLILKKATDLFITLGFKSVTMDDIAQEMGISKKTIYQHYATKTTLVKAVSLYVFEQISTSIDHICALESNPIEEIYSIKQTVMTYLKDEKSSPQYQLQKYYPEIAKNLKAKQFETVQSCITKNLNRGIALGIYRDTINVDFIARLYFNGMMAIKNPDLFPKENYTVKTLMEYYIEYHLRGICTKKGATIINTLITKHTYE